MRQKDKRQLPLSYVVFKTGYKNGIIATHDKAPQVRNFWKQVIEFQAPFQEVKRVCGEATVLKLEEEGLANITIVQMKELAPNSLS